MFLFCLVWSLRSKWCEGRNPTKRERTKEEGKQKKRKENKREKREGKHKQQQTDSNNASTRTLAYRTLSLPCLSFLVVRSFLSLSLLLVPFVRSSAPFNRAGDQEKGRDPTQIQPQPQTTTKHTRTHMSTHTSLPVDKGVPVHVSLSLQPASSFISPNPHPNGQPPSPPAPPPPPSQGNSSRRRKREYTTSIEEEEETQHTGKRHACIHTYTRGWCKLHPYFAVCVLIHLLLSASLLLSLLPSISLVDFKCRLRRTRTPRRHTECTDTTTNATRVGG